MQVFWLYQQYFGFCKMLKVSLSFILTLYLEWMSVKIKIDQLHDVIKRKLHHSTNIFSYGRQYSFLNNNFPHLSVVWNAPRVMQCDQTKSQLSMFNIICPVILDCHGFQAIEEWIIIQAVHLLKVLLQNTITQNTSVLRKCGEINIVFKQ